MINGVEVGRYLQTYSKTDFGPRLGFAYDLNGDGRTIIRGGYGLFWNFTPGGTSSSKAQNQPFLQAQAHDDQLRYRTSSCRTGCAAPPGVNPERAAGRHHALGVPHRLPRRARAQLQRQRAAAVRRQLHGRRSPTPVARTANAALKIDLNQAPPRVGVTDQNVNRPFARSSPALRTVGALSSTGYVDYNGLLIKFQRRSANHFSFLNSYTLGRAIDLNSDNDGTVTLTDIFDPEYNRGPADYDVTHTFSSNWIYELPWAAQTRYGGWQVSGILYLPVGPADHHHAVAEHAVDRHHQQPAEHDLRSGRSSNPTIDQWFNTVVLPAGGRHHRHVRQHRPQHGARPRAASTSTSR